MSLKIRLGLLAGSSLVAAGLMVLAPQAAFAADECVPVPASGTSTDGAGGISDPTLNGSAADSFQCPAGTYATGITYSSSGALSVSMIANAAVVNSTITANGANLTGNGADTVTWNSSVGNLAGGAGTAGPVLDVTSGSGAINITTGTVTATQAGTTHGIRAVSTGGANITISRAAGSVGNNVLGGQAAIAAVTNGGNINITAAGAFTTGRARGILAQTSGAGTINITANNTINASTVDGVAAIDTIAGTGATTIILTGGTTTGGFGATIRSVSAGTVTVQNSATIAGRVDFSGVAGGVTFTGGNWTATGASVFSGVADTISVNGSLAAGGSISLGGGADAFNVSGTFTTAAATLDFGAGADTFTAANIEATGTTFNFGADADTFTLSNTFTAADAVLDFGTGTDAFNQNGVLFWNGTTAFSNLEAFNNSGVIYLGGSRSYLGTDSSDGVANDKLVITGGVFTGSGSSRIVVDANLGTGTVQAGCATLTASDCLDVTGAATAGQTLLTIRDVSFSADGGTLAAAITVVDGSTAEDHFVLDPNSDYYRQSASGPVLRKPVVAYRLTYDAVGERHVLTAAITDEPYQVATFAASAQETWRSTTGSWLTRQADLRATPGGLESGSSVWGKVAASASERDIDASYVSNSGAVFDYDLSHKEKGAHMLFGADLLGATGSDGAWVVGGMVGFVRSDTEFEATPTEASSTGFTGGLYASWLAGPLFVDAVANINMLHITDEVPDMGIGLDVPMAFDLKSAGVQVEAGWRIGSEMFVEPLVGVSYVRTKFDDTVVPGGSGAFDFEDKYESLRIGGGGRVGLDSTLMGMSASYSLTGRYWNDSEAQYDLTVRDSTGASALLADDFGGGFSEVSGSLGLYGSGGAVSGFVNLGGKFADGYQAVDGSVGVRVRW